MKYFLLIFLSSSVFAALPPLEQSSREMQAILTDRQLRQVVGSGESIEEIGKIEGGYLLTTSQHTVFVEVRYQKSEGKIGPAQFELVFHPSSGLR